MSLFPPPPNATLLKMKPCIQLTLLTCEEGLKPRESGSSVHTLWAPPATALTRACRAYRGTGGSRAGELHTRGVATGGVGGRHLGGGEPRATPEVDSPVPTDSLPPRYPRVCRRDRRPVPRFGFSWSRRMHVAVAEGGGSMAGGWTPASFVARSRPCPVCISAVSACAISPSPSVHLLPLLSSF